MKLTDELREWTRNHTINCSDNRIALVAIAERIDEAHKHAIAYVDDRDPEMMTENGWVKLPVDADGEYIRIGDVVTCGEAVWTVTGLRFLGEDWSICCTVYNKYGGSGTNFYPPSDLTHHHPPTVEDVLREFAQEMNENMGMYTGEVINADEWRDADSKTIAEYAAKLRLAGEDE